MCSDFQAVSLRSKMAELHKLEFALQLFSRYCDMLIPAFNFLGSIKAAQIEITWSVSEPAPHLKQGVIVFGRAGIVTDTQPVKSKTTGQLVTSNRDNIQSFRMLGIVKNTLSQTITTPDLNFQCSLCQLSGYLAPLDRSYKRVTCQLYDR